MNLQTIGRDGTVGLHTAAKRLHIPERTLRYRASRGRIPGALKQGKLWKFALSALADAQRRSLVAAILCLVWLTGSHAQVTGAASRKPAPDFTLSDSNGRDVRLSQLQGKVVLVNFWATWVPRLQGRNPLAHGLPGPLQKCRPRHHRRGDG